MINNVEFIDPSSEEGKKELDRFFESFSTPRIESVTPGNVNAVIAELALMGCPDPNELEILLQKHHFNQFQIDIIIGLMDSKDD
jgi:hypothetical protein